MEAPSGPYQALKCSGSVHICQMSLAGASKVRSITTAFSAGWSSVMGPSVLRLDESGEVVVHLVEAGLPDGWYRSAQVDTACTGAASRAHGRYCARRPLSRLWTRSQRIRTAATMPLSIAIVDGTPPPLYQRVADRAQQLRDLGMGTTAIARALGVDRKTICRSLSWGRERAP